MNHIIQDNREWFLGLVNEYDTVPGKLTRYHILLDLAVKVSGM